MADESDFLTALEMIDVQYLYHQEENFFESRRIQHMNWERKEQEYEIFKQQCATVPLRKQVQGRDLDWLKCYSFSDLKTITDDFKNEIRDTLYGKIFCGKIEQDSRKRDVVIKTWNFRYLDDVLYYGDHASRLRTVIKLFMRERNDADESLAKVIGYSIEKKLAVVYDIKASRVLSEELESGNFGWDDRMYVALKLAKLLKWFHSKLYVVGAIDANFIFVDEKYNLTFYEFDLVAPITNMDSGVPREYLIRKSYRFYAPDPVFGTWSVKSDVYAYGFILLRLIMKKNSWLEDEWGLIHDSQAKIQHEELFSLVDGCFEQEPGIGFEITKLALACLDDDPPQRPYITEVTTKLEACVSPQKGESKEEEGEISLQEEGAQQEECERLRAKRKREREE